MRTTIFAGLVGVSLAWFTLPQASHADSAPPSTCKDGTTSTSTGKGTCSGHGGVQKAAKTTAAAAPAAKPVAAKTSAPKTSTCKDGSSSPSTGKGTCSGHGGVQKTAATPAPAN